MEMVMVCCGKGQQPQYRSVHTGIRWTLRGDRKRQQSRRFYISKVKPVFISGVNSTRAGECWAATRVGAAGQRPPGDLAAPKTPKRVLFSRQPQQMPRADPGPIAGTPARGVRPVIGKPAVLAGGCLSTWPVLVSTFHLARC